VLAKQNPGKYWFGSSGLGTITHLTGEVLTRAAGIQMQHSPYKTIVDATGDIFDGRIQMVFDPSFVPYAKAGKVRLVLIDAEVRLADLPDVPTAQEVGLDLKGFRDRAWFGLFGPKGLPAAVASRISGEVARIAATPDMKAKLLLVAQYAHHQSTADFARQVADDRTFFAALLKQLDIKLE
jgi:tripartite-type tricarboxylate transporter receptor subunit TctC